MGNKIFKGLKFPGMDDYYVLPEAVITKNENGIIEIESCLTGTTEIENLDASLTKEGYAADAKAVGEALSTKAPAGYGLGETQSRLLEREDIDGTRTQMIPTGWYHLNPSRSGITIDGWAMNPVGVRVESVTPYGFMVITIINGGRPVVRRGFTMGTWHPWEWISPPMMAGVEYRTTERWNGKPVYAWMIDAGALPNTSTKTVYFSNSASTVDEVIYCGGSTSGGMSLPHVVASTTASVYLDNGRGYVNLITGVDRSASTAKILVKYTKTTD